MKKMIVLVNKSHIAFYDIGQENEAIKTRKSDPRLKYARISEGLQAYPSRIEIGKVYIR